MRIFQSTPLALDMTILLDAKASHHLIRVLRVKLGDEIVLFNGDGHEYPATITQLDKNSATVSINEVLTPLREPPIGISLAQGMARGEKMDWIIQKAVELGATHIYPLITERCNVQLQGERKMSRLTHWKGVIEHACEQCGRNYLPEIHLPQSLSEWANEIRAQLYLVLDPKAAQTITDLPITPVSSVAILIGPEGGLSEHEITLATQKKFLPISLGPRILRTETAAIAALSVLQFQFGDL